MLSLGYFRKCFQKSKINKFFFFGKKFATNHTQARRCKQLTIINMIKTICTWVIILLGFYPSYGQGSTKLDNLIVYDENFSFSVKEPANWIGDIEIAAKYYSNIVFYKNKNELNNGGALVQILVFTKQDEETNKDLDYDISKYEKAYENLKQKDINLNHEEYKCYSKLVFKENDFYQYIVYINPGKKYTKGLSVSMNISKRAANEEEFKAFYSIIKSLWMIK